MPEKINSETYQLVWLKYIFKNRIQLLILLLFLQDEWNFMPNEKYKIKFWIKLQIKLVFTALCSYPQQIYIQVLLLIQ